MTKISILVAVYNTEQYLPQCLNSLLAQTLHDIEIICIDDASTDGSLKILQRYAEQNSCIKVLQMPTNSGSAKARNAGLEIVTGEYVAFVDSDDWLAPDACEQAYNTFAANPTADAVLFRVENVYEDGRRTVYEMPNFDSLDGSQAFEDSLTWKIHGVYVVRTAIHKQFPYDDSAISYSDDNTTRLHYLNARKVMKCDGTYFYRQHSTSVTHRISLRRFDYLLANKSMKLQLEQLNVSAAILNKYEAVRWRNLVGVYMFYFLHRNALDEASRKEGLQRLKETWQTIEIHRLPKSLVRKFGYRPFRCSWTLFRLQEECYFALRALVGRNKEA